MKDSLGTCPLKEARPENLEEIIIAQIKEKGPITFAEFMELALYHPDFGYYASGPQIGREGDFFTSSHVHSLFGETLAGQIREMAELLGDRNFALVEWGAGRGYLAYDLLRTLKAEDPWLWERLTYFIIEASPRLRRRQEELLGQLDLPPGKVRWVADLREGAGSQGAPGLSGCILANEVVDAFPVHRVKRVRGKLKEIMVAWSEGGFRQVLAEPSTAALADYLHTYAINLAPGQEIEINLAALKWLEELNASLEQGFVLLIDYGYETWELADPVRRQGTLMCYWNHRVLEDPYRHVGSQDITAHVNFSALMGKSRQLGLEIAGWTTQMNFLINLGIMERVRDLPGAMAAKRLTLPGGMGTVFKVLALAKGLGKPRLRGFHCIF